MIPFEHSEHIFGLFVALLLGALIGLERRLRGHVAGLHTNALVSLGAAAYVLFATLAGDPTAPARVAGQVVTGVGFLCAGVIMRQQGEIRGLNTAATLWCTSAVGVLAGQGLWSWAGLTAMLAIGANVVFHWVEHRFFSSVPHDETNQD